MAQSFKKRDGLFATVDCASWLDFQIKVNSLLRVDRNGGAISGNFIFRGQSCSAWGLEASFDRKFAHQLAPRALEDFYKRRISAFERNYRIYGGMSGQPLELNPANVTDASSDDMEALAQHFGLATRLMDWSLSLYVAAFFAFSSMDGCKSGMVSVWAMSRLAFDIFSINHVEHIENFYQKNVRNLWQYGSFIKNKTVKRNVAELFYNESPYYEKKSEQEPLLIRFDIPSSEMRVAHDDLNMMRINSMTIFPGIHGVVKWIERADHLNVPE